MSSGPTQVGGKDRRITQELQYNHNKVLCQASAELKSRNGPSEVFCSERRDCSLYIPASTSHWWWASSGKGEAILFSRGQFPGSSSAEICQLPTLSKTGEMRVSVLQGDLDGATPSNTHNPAVVGRTMTSKDVHFPPPGPVNMLPTCNKCNTQCNTWKKVPCRCD